MALSQEMQAKALHNLPRQAFADWAKRIGRAVGRGLRHDDDAELAILFDLALHTANAGGTSAIGRFARSRVKHATAEEALVLAGLCAARFSLFRVTAKTEPVGAILEDVVRGDEIQLLHEGVHRAAQPGDVAAIRVVPIDGFHIPCGPIVPIYTKVADSLVGGFTASQRAAVAENPNAAVIVYAASIRFGLTRNLRVDEGS